SKENYYTIFQRCRTGRHRILSSAEVLMKRHVLKNPKFMRRVIPTLLISSAFLLTGAHIHDKSPSSPAILRKPCYGYTIVEFGKGVDCNGDTINLVKVPGGQARLLSSSSEHE